MSRALIYCRQSLTREEDSLSLAFQERTCRDHAARNGWTVAEPPVLDPDMRGNDPTRPGIAELFKRIEPERIEVVIVYAMSRFARDNILQETLWRQLHARNVRLVSATEPQAEDDLVRGILGVVSQAERKRMGKFLSSSFAERAHRGLPHGRVPFGYIKGNDGRLQIDEDAAGWVRQMASHAEAGWSLWRIARWLNESRPGGRSWEPNSVRNTLKSYAMVGALKCGETIEWDTHEAIIDRARWERIRAILEARKPIRTKQVSSWLEGLIDCGCGAPLHLVALLDRGILRGQFRCAASPALETFQRARAYPVCTHTPRSITQAKAERTALAVITADLETILSPDVVYERAAVAYAERVRSSGRDIARLERQRARLAGERDRLLTIYRRGSLDVDRWETEDRAVGDRLAAVDGELAAYGSEPEPQPFIAAHRSLTLLRDALAADPAQARTVLLRTGARVRLSRDGVIVRWPESIRRFLLEQT